MMSKLRIGLKAQTSIVHAYVVLAMPKTAQVAAGISLQLWSW
jgi:hypothetical protein